MTNLISKERFMKLKKKYNHTVEYMRCNYLVYFNVYGVGYAKAIATMTIRETLNLIKESDCKVYVQYNMGSDDLYCYPYHTGYTTDLDTLQHVNEQDPLYLYKNGFLQAEDLAAYDSIFIYPYSNLSWYDENPV